MKKVELNIEGMHCNGCSTRLEKRLNIEDGVSSAKVELEAKKATIEYDENVTDVEKIKEAVADCGFEAKE